MPKLSQLKIERLRNVMEVVIAGKEEVIEIYNPMDDLRNELVQMLLDNEDEEDVELGKKLYTKLFNECTNIEVDTDLDEMLNNPSEIISLVMAELNEIVHELQVQSLSLNIMKTNELIKISLINLISTKVDTYYKINKECELATDEQLHLFENKDDLSGLIELMKEFNEFEAKKKAPKKKSTKKTTKKKDEVKEEVEKEDKKE